MDLLRGQVRRREVLQQEVVVLDAVRKLPDARFIGRRLLGRPRPGDYSLDCRFDRRQQGTLRLRDERSALRFFDRELADLAAKIRKERAVLRAFVEWPALDDVACVLDDIRIDESRRSDAQLCRSGRSLELLRKERLYAFEPTHVGDGVRLGIDAMRVDEEGGHRDMAAVLVEEIAVVPPPIAGDAPLFAHLENLPRQLRGGIELRRVDLLQFCKMALGKREPLAVASLGGIRPAVVAGPEPQRGGGCRFEQQALVEGPLEEGVCRRVRVGGSLRCRRASRQQGAGCENTEKPWCLSVHGAEK